MRHLNDQTKQLSVLASKKYFHGVKIFTIVTFDVIFSIPERNNYFSYLHPI